MEKVKLYSCEELWDFFKEICSKEICSVEQIVQKYTKEILKKKSYFLQNEEEEGFKAWLTKNYQKKFQNIYENLNKKEVDQETILYSDHSYELLICFLPDDMSSIPENILFSDPSNNIQCVIKDHVSKEFSLLMLNHLKHIFEKSPKIKEDNPTLSRFSIKSANSKDLDLDLDIQTYNSILTSMQLTQRALYITTEEEKTLEELTNIYNSISFEIMCNCNKFPFESYLNKIKILDLHITDSYKDFNELTEIPIRRIYENHIIDYYRLACLSQEPFSQYISYYHVLEYFFDKIFNEDLREEFQNRITSPNFSYKETKDLDSVIKFIKDKTKNNKENGQGNELESLKLVLKKMINLSQLKENLNTEQIDYFQKNKVKFSNGTIISFKDKDKDNFYINLAKRIYQTRNALVHSKDNNKERYKPSQDSEVLRKEIPLIKLVAEQVIIKSSTLL